MSVPLALVAFLGCVSFPGSEPGARLFQSCTRAKDSLDLWGLRPLKNHVCVWSGLRRGDCSKWVPKHKDLFLWLTLQSPKFSVCAG